MYAEDNTSLTVYTDTAQKTGGFDFTRATRIKVLREPSTDK